MDFWEEVLDRRKGFSKMNWTGTACKASNIGPCEQVWKITYATFLICIKLMINVWYMRTLPRKTAKMRNMFSVLARESSTLHKSSVHHLDENKQIDKNSSQVCLRLCELLSHG